MLDSLDIHYNREKEPLNIPMSMEELTEKGTFSSKPQWGQNQVMVHLPTYNPEHLWKLQIFHKASGEILMLWDQ